MEMAWNENLHFIKTRVGEFMKIDFDKFAVLMQARAHPEKKSWETKRNIFSLSRPLECNSIRNSRVSLRKKDLKAFTVELEKRSWWEGCRVSHRVENKLFAFQNSIQQHSWFPFPLLLSYRFRNAHDAMKLHFQNQFSSLLHECITSRRDRRWWHHRLDRFRRR